MPDDEQIHGEDPGQVETPPAQPPAEPEWKAAMTGLESRLAEERARAERAEAVAREVERQAQERIAEALRAVESVSRTEAPATPQDDGDILTKGELRKTLAEFQQNFAGATQSTINQSSAVVHRNLRQANRELAARDPSLKHFGKYAAEIDQQLDKLPPEAAAHPEAYKKLYKIVMAEHLDDVLKDEVAAQLAAMRSQQAEDAEYEPEAPATRRAEPPIPRGDGGRGAVTLPGGRARLPKLTDDERFVVDRYFGGDASSYIRERDNPDSSWLKKGA